MQSSRAKGISCILDTDVVIDFLRRREYARQLLEKWAGEGLLAISTLTQLEVYRGMKSGEEKATNFFLDGLISVVVDVPVARRAGALLGQLRSRGVTVSTGDAIIAATSLQVNAPLVTNNVRHYPFTAVKVVQGLET
ncbi:MAG: type II toxin-antitoxin system VapC family toxin [Chloroflexi bacterium]|nr:type II toxin-antitoxin system VapC family toxin [Chloroflexota bacterium]